MVSTPPVDEITAAAIAAPAATFQELCASIDGRLRAYGYKLPEEMGMLRDSHTRSGLDVLVLSKFSVWGDELQEVWNVSGEEVSLGFWSFYCAKKDFKGRMKLHSDIAHPINADCRKRIQERVISAFKEEVEKSKLPGYKPVEIDEPYDDIPQMVS